MRRLMLWIGMALALPSLAAAPALAQSIQKVDPDTAIDADLGRSRRTL
jgi:hypothetical protein